MKPAQQLYRVPDCRAVNDHGRRGHEDSDQGIQCHGYGECQCLSNRLLTLAAREPREVGNVERHSGPETYRAVQRRYQEFQKVGEGSEARRSR